MTMKDMMQAFKNILPRTLFARSLLIIITPIFLLQIITTFTFFDRHWQKMGYRLSYSVANEIGLIANMVELDDRPDNIQKIQKDVVVPLDLSIIYKRGETLRHVYDKNKTGIQTAFRDSYIAESLADTLRPRIRRPFNVDTRQQEKWVGVSVQLNKGVLHVAIPERRIFSSSGYVVLLWMVGSSAILVAIATLFMRNQIRPIRRLAVAAERFGKGRDVPFFKVEGAREVRQAAQAFLGMKDRLKRQIEQRTAMLAGVSHDLRTPLTRMKLQLEMMGNGADVQDLKSDVSDMHKMIEAYLQFAKGEGEEDLSRVDMGNFIMRIAQTFNRDFERVFVDVPRDMIVSVRPVAFERCLSNIIGNATKYGKHAWVHARRMEDMIEICVDDDGPGIPPDQYDDVFKPFFRGESSRNSKTGGVGLGLPIVREIVLAHGGRIWLDKSPQGGGRVLVDLPV
jgi:two-component system, OmpR family, osmolarity sensor histidine kinase EnvZ